MVARDEYFIRRVPQGQRQARDERSERGSESSLIQFLADQARAELSFLGFLCLFRYAVRREAAPTTPRNQEQTKQRSPCGIPKLGLPRWSLCDVGA